MHSHQALFANESAPLCRLPKGVQTRWATAENPKSLKGSGGRSHGGRKGTPCYSLAPGESQVVAEVQNKSGMVRRIWSTITPCWPQAPADVQERLGLMLRGLRIDAYWDGQEKPAVSAPLGDFFGHCVGKMSTFESALFSSPEGRSFNCHIPMPFKMGMKIVVTNETEFALEALFFEVDYTVGEAWSDDVIYFHAHWRRENPTELQKDFEILPQLNGAGRYLGTHIGVIGDTEKYLSSWWGEGEVKVYLDGDTDYPTLCGTGTEDYIGTGWGQGQYSLAYQGCHLADNERQVFCFYRLHIPDPVYFRKDIRVTIQQIGAGSPGVYKAFKTRRQVLHRTGHGLIEMDWNTDEDTPLFERQDDWSCCTYFYLNSPVNNLPPLSPLAERIADLP